MIEIARHSKYIKIKPKVYKEWAAKVLYGERYNYPKDLDKKKIKLSLWHLTRTTAASQPNTLKLILNV